MFFDLGMSELLLIGVVALVVIGPKDLPKALRVAGFWVKKARTLSREFQSSVEQMIREAELDEMRQELKKATEIDLDKEFRQTIDPTGSLAESLKPPELPKFSDADLPAAPAPEPAQPSGGCATEAAEPEVPAIAPPATQSAARHRLPHGCRLQPAMTSRRVDSGSVGTDGGRRQGGRARRRQDAAARSLDRAAQPADVGDRRGARRVSDLLSVQGADLRLSGPPAGGHLRGADRAAPDLHRPDRGLFHLRQGVVLGRALPRFPDRRQPDLEVRRARPLQERAAGLLPLPFRHPGAVRDGRGARLFRRDPGRLAVLRQLRDAGPLPMAGCRSSSRRRSTSTCRW